MNPWEKYGGQTAQKPWEKYGAVSPPILDEAKSPSVPKTILDQGLQGATFGFADEATDRIGAGIASMATDVPYDQLLKEARESTQQQLSSEMENRPVLSIASQLGGGLLTGVAGASTKAGGAVGNFVRSGNLGARVAKGAVSGAISGGLYGVGSGVDGERTDSAIRGAVLGGAVGAAIPVVGNAIKKVNTKTVIPNSDQIKEQASKLYAKAEQLGGQYKPEFTDRFLTRARKSLLSDDEIINSMRSNKPLSDTFGDLQAFSGQPMSLSRAQALDEQLGSMVEGFVDNQGNLSKAGKKILDVQRQFRNMIENSDDSMLEGSKDGFEALKQGRKLWATSRRLADVERIVENADLYQVPATAIKTGFRRLYNSSKILGYSTEEAKAIKKAAETGVISDLLSTLGSRLNVIGGMFGGPASGVLSYGASTTARAGATASQMSRAENAAKIIAEKSGMISTSERIPFSKIMSLPPAQAKSLLQTYGVIKKSAPVEAKEKILMLPSPNSARPMTESEILQARKSLDRKMPKKSSESQSLGDVPYNYIVPQPPEKQLLLPSPQKDIIVTPSGKARTQTVPEQNKSSIERERAKSLGLSPDVSKQIGKAEIRQKIGGDWDNISKEQQNAIETQINDAWRANKEPLEKIIMRAKANAQYLAEAKGEKFRSSSLADALLNASKLKK